MDRDRKSVRVLVVGGGVSALSVAAFVSQSGYAVTLAPTLAPRGSGLVVAGNGVRMLSLVGDAVLAAGVPSQATTVRDRRGEVVGSEPTPGAIGIAREALESALRAASPSVVVRPPAELSALDASGKAVRVSHGGDAEYDLVIGADGARSRVRALAFADAPITDAPFVMTSFVARVDEGAGRILGDGITLAHAPIAPGSSFVRVVTSVHDGDAHDPRDPKALAEAVGPAGAALFASMDEASLLVSPLVSTMAPRWSTGAVLLVGNAAHPLHPLLDQDPAMSFEDARALEVALDRGATIAEALATFEAMRRERVTAVHEASWRRAGAAGKKRGFAASFRSVLHRLAPSLWADASAAPFTSESAEIDALVSHRPDLHALTPEARDLLRFLVKIGQADGRFDRAEHAFVRAALQELGHYVTDAEMTAIEHEVYTRMVRELTKPFRDKPEDVRARIFESAVLLAAESGRIASDEYKALREAAHDLGIPAETHQRLLEEAIAHDKG